MNSWWIVTLGLSLSPFALAAFVWVMYSGARRVGNVILGTEPDDLGSERRTSS
jgi:hypothetical protein